LRVTAPPTAFETVTPTRTPSLDVGSAKSAKVAAELRRPLRRTAAISLERRSRSYQRKPLDREALAPLLPAARDDAAAVGGRHPFEEAVNALTATVVGLVGAFH